MYTFAKKICCVRLRSGLVSVYWGGDGHLLERKWALIRVQMGTYWSDGGYLLGSDARLIELLSCNGS